MKATLRAVVLLSLVIPFLAQAAIKNSPPSALPPTEQSLNKINLNTADAQALTQSFKGIGKKRAEAIVHYRENHGAFKSVAELAEVRGLGESFVKGHLAELQKVFTVLVK